MRNMRTGTVIAAGLATVGGAGLIAADALAVPIELQHQGRLVDGTGSPITGSIGGLGFSSASFTITGIADTEAVESEASATLGPDALILEHTSAQIEIEGVGIFDLLTPTLTGLSTTDALVALGDAGDGDPFELTGITDRPFQERDLPVGFAGSWGDGEVEAGASFDTSGGLLTFDGGAIETRFSIIVPAPGGAALLGLGAVASARRRRR